MFLFKNTVREFRSLVLNGSSKSGRQSGLLAADDTAFLRKRKVERLKRMGVDEKCGHFGQWLFPWPQQQQRPGDCWIFLVRLLIHTQQVNRQSMQTIAGEVGNSDKEREWKREIFPYTSSLRSELD